MKIISLQSGSNGNCIYVEAGQARLLFDAGISGKRVAERLALHNREVCGVDAVLVSHDHSDHSMAMGILHRKFALPIFVTEKTFNQVSYYREVGEISALNHFKAGSTIRIKNIAIESYSTPHDACDGVVFVVDDGKRRVGILTDLGHVFSGLGDLISSLDAVLLESNYDPQMLQEGPYPLALQRRIRGAGGHLSNFEAAELLESCCKHRMKWACLAHLSEECNTPEKALGTHKKILGRRLPLHLASRYGVGEILEV